jgi:hypothetical protein
VATSFAKEARRPGTAKFGGAAHDGACHFEFTVGGIPEVAVYGIRIEERGTMEYSLAEMKQQNWSVRLQLSAD